VRRAYKFRAYPTRPQEGRAARLLADHCDLYNAALEERREAWRMRQDLAAEAGAPALVRDRRRRKRAAATCGHQPGSWIDMGVARFLTTSDGEFIPNPKFGVAAHEVISRLQQRQARTRSGWPARDLGEPGWHQHRLPPVRATMYPPAAGHRDLPGARPDGRGRERGSERHCQGRAGLWSGRASGLRSCRPQPIEQSRSQLPLTNA